jgi:hypothetical protein
LSCEEGNIGLTVFEDIVGLFGLCDDSDGTDQEVWDGLFDVFGELDLCWMSDILKRERVDLR